MSTIFIVLLGILGIIAVLISGMYVTLSSFLAAVGIIALTILTVVQVWRERALGRRMQRTDAHTESLAFTAHQLRSPLSVIKGYSDLIIDGTFGKTSNEVADAALKMRLSTDRALKIIDELLDFNSLEAGRMSCKAEPIVLNDFIKENIKEHERAALEKNLSLTFTPAPHDLTVNFDPVQLRHVFDNLIDNALKYTEKGKIEIRTSLSSDGHSAILKVGDTGKGIPVEILESIFMPFERDPRHAHDTKGMGLGLAIAKKMVEINGGKIWAESDGIGKGATFYVKLSMRL